MKKRIALLFALIFVFALILSTTAFATTYPSDGSNTSHDTAIQIPRNRTTAASYKNADNSFNEVATGTLNSINEEHWYSVVLPANPDTVLTINCSDVWADVYDANLNFIFGDRFRRISGAVPHYVNITSTGLYYVRLYNAPISASYTMTIGNPQYALANQTVIASTLTLRPEASSVQTQMNLISNTLFPEDAIAYEVALGSSRNSTVTREKRFLRYANENNFTEGQNITRVTYDVSQNRLVRNLWTIRWDGIVRTATSWNPDITFRYVHAILPIE